MIYSAPPCLFSPPQRGANYAMRRERLLNFNCITFFILIMIIIPHRTLHNRRCRPEA